jgi:hypothetical protein
MGDVYKWFFEHAENDMLTKLHSEHKYINEFCDVGLCFYDNTLILKYLKLIYTELL